jgi:hypothetical protein
MIQRIQSVWLLAAALFASLTFKFSFYSGNRTETATTPQFEKLVASSNFLLVIFTSILVAGCLIIIFLYKNRNQQLWLTIAATGLSIINLIIYFGEIKKFIPKEGNYDLTAIFAFAIPVFLFLAARGIRKDQKLLKTLDRLR